MLLKDISEYRQDMEFEPKQNTLLDYHLHLIESLNSGLKITSKSSLPGNKACKKPTALIINDGRTEIINGRGHSMNLSLNYIFEADMKFQLTDQFLVSMLSHDNTIQLFHQAVILYQFHQIN